MVVRPDDAIPNEQPARRVPVALKKPLLDELARMAKPSIIAKVEGLSEWVSPLDQVRKNDTDTYGAVGVRAAHIWPTKAAADTLREDSAIDSLGVYVSAICARRGDG
ncbi:hypothetical protein HPB52_003146 [Rhipicephalus sanguineus]|uniref:Uncharacterized protein n=1 Tax=Rhipicephalus sanguineus TaxID=34632 RepID=A0A9D4PEP1_RHISA|nr:hypothetical protein HPB52_003146 [Rhipicephalus sanguineus]